MHNEQKEVTIILELTDGEKLKLTEIGIFDSVREMFIEKLNSGEQFIEIANFNKQTELLNVNQIKKVIIKERKDRI